MNPVALITGASRGIGRGIALELARIGYDLALNYLNNQEAALKTMHACHEIAVANRLTTRTEICQADVSLRLDRTRLVEFTRSAFGRLDLLVNNAGVAPTVRADLLESS